MLQLSQMTVAQGKYIRLELNLRSDRRPCDAGGTAIDPVLPTGVAGRTAVTSSTMPEHHLAELPVAGKLTRKLLRLTVPPNSAT
jgi:hypothetical protein